MTRGWDVLLIGGASGVGKSSIAYPLARDHGIPVLEVDDIVCALKAVTTPAEQPELFFWDTHPAPHKLSIPAIVAQGRALSAALQPALEAVIGNHLETDMPVVIEGDFILPVVATLDAYAGVPAAGRVGGLFVLEDDPDQIAANYRSREPAAGDQAKRAAVSVAWDAWLRAETARLGVPTVNARPWADAVVRAAQS